MTMPYHAIPCLVMALEPTAAAARMAQNNAIAERRRPVQMATGRMDRSVLRIRFVTAVRVNPVQMASMFRGITASQMRAREQKRRAATAAISAR